MNKPRWNHYSSGKWQREAGRAVELFQFQGDGARRAGGGKEQRGRGERSPWEDVAEAGGWARAFESQPSRIFLPDWAWLDV